MCEFHDSNCNGFGDIWWTDKLMNFSSKVVAVKRNETNNFIIKMV